MWLWLAGCVTSEYAVALDYRIDRTVVAAMRVTPRVAPGGVPRTFEALVLSPRPVERRRWATCGYTVGVAAEVWTSCYEEPSLVEELGEGATLTWTPPSIGVEGCDQGHTGLGDGCWSTFPLRLTAEDAEGAGSAVIPLAVLADGEEAWDLPGPVPLTVAVVEGEPRAGAEILLEAHTLGRDLGQEFRWYVDGGELLGTGRTLPWTVEDGVTTSHNRLRIPADWEGPLRVAVVVDQDGEESWTLETLEVP